MARPCLIRHPEPEKSEHHCRLCWLWRHDASYSIAWGGDGKVISGGPRFTRRLPRLCRHLGPATGETRPCQACGGKDALAHLHHCRLHSVCTPQSVALPQLRTCRTCADNEPPAVGSTRHLLYHAFPVPRSAWLWNVRQLKRRLSLFNGRRLIGIAVDGSTEHEALRAELAGCGCEFAEFPNNPSLREGVTFDWLFGEASRYAGAGDVTLWGHTKGITTTDQAWSPGVQRWAESLYISCLDHWPAVRRLLGAYPVVGPWKRLGYCFEESTRSDWHYSGSWHWFRNADLFGRGWRDIETHWCCLESYPSLHFRREEAAALIHEFSHSGLALYTEEFWRDAAGPAWREWQDAHYGDRQNPLLLTCILVSHRKPAYIHDAVRSILAQTVGDWQLVVIDSGDLLAAGEFARYAGEPRIQVVASGETEAMRGRVALQSWCINECFRRGLVRGDLVCYLSDDDVYSPQAFALWLAAARSNPDQEVWYGAAERREVDGRGGNRLVGMLPAAALGGMGGISLRCKIDGMQVCHRTSLRVEWPEAIETAPHADGLFLETLGQHTAIHPLPAVIGQHRHTPVSVFTQRDPA